jgi:hypothetical protein
MAMTTDKRIRIIRRSERHERRTAPAEKGGARTLYPAARANRDAVSVVNGWVSELRRRKVAEEGRGFESLFKQPAVGTTPG